MISFDFTDCIQWKYPLTQGQKLNLLVKELPLPCDWAEEYLDLVSPGYLYPGRFRARPVQREIINAFHYCNNTITIGPVQFGKSLTGGEIPAYYSIGVLGLSVMLCYANNEKAEDAFEDRFIPMVKNKLNTQLYDKWNKKEDNLTKGKIKLLNCILRVASARNKNALASFTAPFTIASEAAKYFIQDLKYDPLLLLKGRSAGAYGLGASARKFLVESSPYEEGDLLYQEVFREGTCILRPYYKCLLCGCWQELTDYQIKLRDKDLKGRPARIRELKEEACFYECIGCKREITEAMRIEMDKFPVWAMPEITDIEGFKQVAERIQPDGAIAGRREGGVRAGYDTYARWLNRLSDVNFPFWENLAQFFETLHDPTKKKSYENETMARWTKKFTDRIEIGYLDSKIISGYFQWGKDHRIPENVLDITYGGDSQDNGFYYVYLGWGEWLSCIVLRHGFIPAPRVEKGYEFQVRDKFLNNLYVEPLLWADGRVADFSFGLQDRGGHRPDEVDYIVKHFPGNRLRAYVGLTTVHPDREIIYKSENGPFFLGQSDPLSEDAGKIIAGFGFGIPEDTELEFKKQIGRQFHQKIVRTDGTITTKWIHKFQGDDHYRDAFNLAYGALIVSGKDKLLVNPQFFESMKISRPVSGMNRAPSDRSEQSAIESNKQREHFRNRRSSYFNNLGGRLR